MAGANLSEEVAEMGRNEADRLAALERYRILDTDREAAFDDIVELAAVIFEAPIAVVNLVADGRQWFKAEIGIGTRELPLDVSICSHAILQRGVFVVPDLTADPRFQNNPLVTAAGGLRFYAGALLETPDGLPLGTVCVLDVEPRPEGVTERQARALKALASQTMAQLEARRSQIQTRASEARLHFLDRLAAATQLLTEADDVMTATARLLAEHLRLSVCAYADMDEDEDGFTIRGDWAAPGSTSIVGHYSLADFGTLAVENLRAGLPLVINDNLREIAPEAAATFQSIGIAATICMPLVKDGRLTALMAIHDRVPRRWTDEELSLLREVTTRSWAHVERVGATAELRASEGRFRAAVDAVQGVLWTNSAAGEMDGEQLGWAELTGQSVDEYRGYGWSAAVHPDDAEPTITAWNAAVASKQTFVFEHRLRRRDGEWRRFSIRAIPIFDAAGEIREWVGVHTDITSRKAAEAALRASETRLRAVFDQAAAGFARTDLTGRFQQVNDRYCEIAGRSRDELLTLRMQDITHPDDLGANAPLFEKTAAGGPSFEIEKRYIRPDASVVWVRNSVSAVREDGAEEGILAVTIDISDRKRAEEALRELNDTLESQVNERTAERDRMWNTSPDLMLVMDFQGHFRRVNPAWTALLGFTPDELVGHHVNEFVLPEDHAPTVDAYELAAEGGQPSIVNRYRHKDGSVRWISWAAAPAGEMTYAAGRDVTAEKRRETELTAAQEALRQSQKMEAMGQLTGGVAHDFNNLLTPIIGSLDMLVRRGVGSDRERRLIDGALQSAERAKTLVQRLLAFARRQPLQPVSVEIPKLVEGMIGLISSTLGPTIDVRVDLASDLPPAKADANQLEMALLNLAVNARDAMPGGGELTIEAKGESLHQSHASGLAPGEYVLLRVVDTGAGMDNETLRRAIEPFFSTKGVGKGTGLGLSMVHGLAAQLGGGMTIHSAPGKGTTIELRLPISTAPASGQEVITSSTTKRAGRGVVLLVDDEELVRMSTADMLIDLGFEVIEAGTGEEALRLIKSNVSPNLLVTDHLMPGMSGVELAREVRAIKPELPVLVVSGYAEVDGIAPELARLTKPFRNSELAASIAALVSDDPD